MLSDYEYILKVETAGFLDILNVECKKVKDDLKSLGLGSLKPGVAID